MNITAIMPFFCPPQGEREVQWHLAAEQCEVPCPPLGEERNNPVNCFGGAVGEVLLPSPLGEGGPRSGG